MLYELVIFPIDLTIPAERVRSSPVEHSEVLYHNSHLSNSALANLMIGSVSGPFVRAVRSTVLYRDNTCLCERSRAGVSLYGGEHWSPSTHVPAIPKVLALCS